MKKRNLKFNLLSFCLISCYSSVVMADNTKIEENAIDKLDEIVVIGEGVERSQQQTGTSLSVITSKDIQKRSDLYSLTPLLKQTPNILETGLGNELPSIRGIEGSSAPGAMAFLTGARPRVNVQVDGNTSNYNELAFGTKSLWDIKQVEIFRGPQSYAQGRNAIAGAIVMQSFDPINKFEGAVKADFGNQHRRQLAAMLSGPIVDEQLLFRLSVDQQGRQSYEDLATYHPAGDSSKFKTTTTRAKLLWLPSSLPDFYSRLTFAHVDSRSPQGEFKSNTVADTYRSVFKTRSATSIWDVGYQINDSWGFESKYIYANFIHDRFAPPTGGPGRVEGHKWQIEPILRFNDGTYSGLIGLFYFESPQDDSVLLINRNTYHDKTKTKAVFGEITFKPVDFIEVNFSSRYEQEDHTRVGGNLFTLDYKKKENVFLPKLDVAYLISDDQRIGAKIARGYNPGGAGISFLPPFKTYTYDSEYVWNYELYHRWISEDKRLKINTNVFYNDYKDMQIPYVNNFGSPTIANADKAITYGAEFNIEWQATENLNLVSGIGLLKTKIKKYNENESYINNKLSRSPGYTLSLGGYYKLPNGVETGINTNFTDGYYSDISNHKNSKVNSYSQTNAYVSYSFKHGRVTLYADNIFNSQEKVKAIISGPATYNTYQQPRQVGLSTELHF